MARVIWIEGNLSGVDVDFSSEARTEEEEKTWNIKQDAKMLMCEKDFAKGRQVEKPSFFCRNFRYKVSAKREPNESRRTSGSFY